MNSNSRDSLVTALSEMNVTILRISELVDPNSDNEYLRRQCEYTTEKLNHALAKLQSDETIP